MIKLMIIKLICLLVVNDFIVLSGQIVNDSILSTENINDTPIVTTKSNLVESIVSNLNLNDTKNNTNIFLNDGKNDDKRDDNSSLEITFKPNNINKDDDFIFLNISPNETSSLINSTLNFTSLINDLDENKELDLTTQLSITINDKSENKSKDKDDKDDKPENKSYDKDDKTDDKSSNKEKNKLSFEECVALGGADCVDDREENKEDDESKAFDNSGFYLQTISNNQTDAAKLDNLEEKNSQQIWNELPVKFGLPFILLLLFLFIIVLILFLIFLIQDSFFRKNTNSKETLKIKTGYGTQNVKLNQLKLIEQRINAAKLDCDLDEVHVQKTLNNSKTNHRLSDEQNNNVPNNQKFEEIALESKNISHM